MDRPADIATQPGDPWAVTVAIIDRGPLGQLIDTHPRERVSLHRNPGAASQAAEDLACYLVQFGPWAMPPEDEAALLVGCDGSASWRLFQKGQDLYVYTHQVPAPSWYPRSLTFTE
jgi:hypothetical protein